MKNSLKKLSEADCLFKINNLENQNLKINLTKTEKWVSINSVEKPKIGEVIEAKDSNGYLYDCTFTNTSSFIYNGNVINDIILWKRKK